MKNLFHRRHTSEIHIGNVPLGCMHPVRLQSMTNTDTMQTEQTVDQVRRLVEAGCDYVRIAAPDTKSAANLYEIKNRLHQLGCTVPLIADIHFQPQAAEIAATIVEKVRINPGNYIADSRIIAGTENDYAAELAQIAERIHPLLELCKKHHTAIRIGTNHGSLSPRILNRYGDTPQGMVASAMEFIRICEQYDFRQLVLSMKASQVKVMIYATRLLVQTMEAENMFYPIHLGVTEAGDGEDGRLKSAAGIGVLLADGIGDTIRVSLTEDPVSELPVAKALKNFYPHSPVGANPTKMSERTTEYSRYETLAVGKIGHGQMPVVVTDQPDSRADACAKDLLLQDYTPISAACESEMTSQQTIRYFQVAQYPLPTVALHLKNHRPLWRHRHSLLLFIPTPQSENDRLKAAIEAAYFLVEGLIDGIYLPSDAAFGLDLLQAAGDRLSKAEFIACPSCGRTKYDIQSALKSVKAACGHLTGVRIAVMGCIVNGPGEMADAHYGYIGAGNNKVNLYKGKTCVAHQIEQENAIEALVSLIKESGDWIETTSPLPL